MRQTIEKFSFVFFFGGFGLLIFSVAAQAGLPFLVLKNVKYATADEIAQNVDPAFTDMARRWPENFEAAFPGGPTPENYAEALRTGKRVYIAEACWHCHSQFVRPISNEAARWGKISYASEYQTELHKPPLLGTRRVGPDLSRESWVHSNDWHAAHFYKPTDVVPVSVMPNFPWLFDENRLPNKRGLSLIAYVQFLGSWIPEEERLLGVTTGITPEMLDAAREDMPEVAVPSAAPPPSAAPVAPAATSAVMDEAAPAGEAAPAAAPAEEVNLDDVPIKEAGWAKPNMVDKPWTVSID